MTALTLNIYCRGDENFVLDVQCQLPATGITAIYGQSGSGKSTLLDCIAGLREAETGSEVTLGATRWQSGTKPTPPWQRELAYVFQDARLFPHLNVKKNLEYAHARRIRNQAGAAMTDVVKLLELEDLLMRLPQSLSAGQKQRVAIARALVRAPQLLLLDEPLANLDHTARLHLCAALRDLSSSMNIPMLYVSHDIEEVSQLADHLVLLHDGKITQHGTLLDLCSRLDTRISQEEQAAAILNATIAQQENQFGLAELELEQQTLYVNPQQQAAGQLCRVRIPARDVSVCRSRPEQSSILNILPVTVVEIEETSSPRLLLRLALGSQHLLARITKKSLIDLNIKVGDELFAQIKSAALLLEATSTA